MNRITQRTHRVLSLALLVGAVGSLHVRAQTTGWTQTGSGPYDYNDTGNWVGGTINGIWDSSLTLTATQTATVGANTTAAGGLQFLYDGAFSTTLRADGTGPYTLNLGGGINYSLNNPSQGSRTVTLGSSTGNQNLNINLGGATRTLTGASSRTLTLWNVMSNGGIRLEGSGAGTVNMYGVNSYSGDTTVTVGTLNLGSAAGSAANSDIFVVGNSSNTSTLQFGTTTGSGTTRAKSVSIDGTGNSSSGALLNVTGNSGANSVDTITNALTAEAGYVRVVVSANASRSAQLSAGSFVRNAGASVLFRGTDLGVSSVVSNTAGDANIVFSSAPALTGGGGAANTSTVSILKGAYGDTSSSPGDGRAGNLVTYDATYGVRLLNTATEYTTSISDGQTQLDNARLSRVSGGASQDVNLTAATTTVNSLSFYVSGAGTNSGIAVGGNAGTTLKLESGTLFASQLVTTATSSDAITISVPTLDLNGQEGVITAFTTGINNGNTSGALFISSVIANDGGNGVTFGGLGQTRLTGSSPNTYTGVTTLNSGVLRLEKSSGVQSITGDFVMNGGTLIKASNTIADSASVTINGGTFWLDSTTSSGNNGTSETFLNLTMTGGGLVGSSSGNGASLFVNGDANLSGGTIRLNIGGDVTIAGNTLLNGGLISARESSSSSSYNALVNLGDVEIVQAERGDYTGLILAGHASNRGALVTLNGDVTFTATGSSTGNTLIDHTNPALANLGRLALNGTRTFDIGDGAAENDLTIVPEIIDGSSTGGLTKTGQGVLALQGQNSYTGLTTVNAGVLRIETDHNRVSTLSTLVVNGGASAANAGTFDLNGLNQSVNGLNGGAGVVTGKVTNDSDSPGTSLLTVTGTGSFAGTIEDGAVGTVALAVTGGTQTLTGDNTYTGSTSVTGGTLALSGGSNVSPQFAVSGSGSFTQSGTDWTTDLFHITGGGASVEVAQLAKSTDGESVLRYTVATSGLSGIDLTDANPFAQYDSNAAVGLDLWAGEWSIEVDTTNGIGVSKWLPSYSLLSGYDLTDLGAKINLTAYASSGGPFVYEDVIDGQAIYLSSQAASIAKYTVSFSESGLELIYASARGIPEPSTLGLLAMAAAVLRRRFRA